MIDTLRTLALTTLAAGLLTTTPPVTAGAAPPGAPPAHPVPAEALAGVAGAGGSQAGHNLEPPPGWEARLDDGTAGERRLVVMRPGWHVHAGPAGIFWDTGSVASGNYSVTSTFFLFPLGEEGSSGATRIDTPYGLFLAGTGLDGATPEHVSFTVRNDGSFRVAHHAGEEVHELTPWTPHDAVAVLTEEAAGTAENVLGVDATDDAVTFWVNDEQVASFSRADFPLEGTIGLRAGEGLSLHVTEIAIGPNRR